MLVPVYIPRTTKPPLGTPIDWGNPLTQGLLGAWALNENIGGAVNAVNNKIGVNTALWTPTGLDVTSGIMNTGSNPPADNNSELSIVTGITWNGAAFNYSRILGKGTSQVRFELRGNNSLFLSAFRTASEIYRTSNNLGLVANTRCIVAGTLSVLDNTINMYKDGKELGYGSMTVGSGAIQNSATNNISIGLTGNSFPGVVDFAYYYRGKKSPIEIASLSANPWQIYEPEILWVEVGGGNTIYTETLTDLITSQTNIADRQDYLETASVLIQSGISTADVQTMLEAVLILAASTTSVSDTLVQPGSFSEALLVTATAVTLASDAQTFVEAVTTTAQTATSLSDLQLMLDNVSILCQSQVSAVEIQNYLQSIIVTASATGSLTDVLVGAFMGRYLAIEYATGRSFADLAQARSFAEQATARSFIEYASPRGRA